MKDNKEKKGVDLGSFVPSEEQRKHIKFHSENEVWDTDSKRDDDNSWIDNLISDNEDEEDVVEKGKLNTAKLHLKDVTDRDGKHTKRWVKNNEEEVVDKRKHKEDEGVDKKKQALEGLGVSSKKTWEKDGQDYSGDWNTSNKYAGDVNGYSKERFDLHNEIGKKIYADSGESQDKPIVILMGGGSASGKSTMLKHIIMPTIKKEGKKFAIVDSDSIKDSIPEYEHFKSVSLDTGASRVHKESSDIAGLVVNKLIENKKNFILDGTMTNPEKYIQLVNKLKKSGYIVQLAIADVSEEEAIKRAIKRAKEEGRNVPVDAIKKSHRNIPSVFDVIKDKADTWQIFNTEAGGEVIATHEGIKNKELYNSFTNKNYVDDVRPEMLKLPKKLLDKVKRRDIGKGEQIDITREEATLLLNDGIIGFVSAGKNPNLEPNMSQEEQDKRGEELKKDLIEKGYVFIKVRGYYDGEEDSYMVMMTDARREEMVELGKKYNQDSVIYSQGNKNEFIYTTGKNEGKKHLGSDYKLVGKKQDNFYTNIKTENGYLKFAFNFDFDNMVEKSLMNSAFENLGLIKPISAKLFQAKKYLDSEGKLVVPSQENSSNIASPPINLEPYIEMEKSCSDSESVKKEKAEGLKTGMHKRIVINKDGSKREVWVMGKKKSDNEKKSFFIGEGNNLGVNGNV